MTIRVDLYSAAGARLDVPPLVDNDVLGFSYGPSLGRIGTFTLSVAADSLAAAGLAIARQCWCYDSVEGLVFKGIFEDLTNQVDADGKEMLVAVGRSTAASLTWATTLLGRTFDNQTLSSVVSTLVSGTQFTAGDLDTPSTNITTRMDGRTVWEALSFVAEVFGLSLREDNLDTRIDIGAFGTSSGIVLRNVPEHSVGLADNPNLFAIRTIKKRTYALDIANSVIPIAQQTGIAGSSVWFSLANSNRSSPYTIQNAVGPDSQTYYYISDSTSVASYGTRQRVIQVRDILPLGTSTTDFQRAANTLYDEAVTYLQRHKDPIDEYEVEVVGLRHVLNGAYRFQVGDTFRVQFDGNALDSTNGTTTALSVDRDLYLMGFTRTYNTDGSDTWRLTLSTVLREVPNNGNVTERFMNQLQAVKAAPLPYVLFGDNILRMDSSAIQVDGTLGAKTGIWFLDGFKDDPTTSGLVGYLSGSAIPDFGGEPYADARMGAQSTTGTEDATVTVVASGDGLGIPTFHVQGITSLDGGVTGDLYYTYDAAQQKFVLTLDGVSVGGAMKSANTGPYLIPTLGTGTVVRNGNGSYGSYSPLPAADMTAPATPTTTNGSSSAGSHNVNMPGTVAAGDLLVMAIAINPGAGASITTPGGWTLLGSVTQQGTAATLGIYYKSAAGTEGGTTVSVTHTASELAAQVVRILAADWEGTPTAATATTGTSGQPDAGTVTPTQTGRFITLNFASSILGSSFPTGGGSGFQNIGTGASLGDVGCSFFYENVNSNSQNGTSFSGASGLSSWVANCVAVNTKAAAVEALYITGLDVVVSGTPGYVQIQLATGASGAESVIGTFKLNTADPTLEFPAIIPVSAAARISARMATDAAAANHNVTLHVINQDDVQ